MFISKKHLPRARPARSGRRDCAPLLDAMLPAATALASTAEAADALRFVHCRTGRILGQWTPKTWARTSDVAI